MTANETIALLNAETVIAAAVPVEVLKVHDGDTFSVEIAGWPNPVDHMLIRMAHIDAPELKDKRPEIAAIAVRARDHLITLLTGKAVLTSIRKDNYFRLLCTVEVDGKDVGTAMLQPGLARPYEGRGPKPW